MLTALRPAGDINAGNYWGMPSDILWYENFAEVIFNLEVGPYMINSIKITVPTMLGAVGIACLTGYALAVYRFKLNLFVFFMFIAGNFVPFQILMVPVRDLTIQLGCSIACGASFYSTSLPPGFAPCSCVTSSKRSLRFDRGGLDWRRRVDHFLAHRIAADAACDRGAVRVDLYLYLERSFSGPRY